jgi:hypothetical protein
MMQSCADLTLAQLNEATQAWVEFEYNREVHSETGQAPLQRYLAGPDLGRAAPGSDELRLAFRRQERRSQRRSDGTVLVEGVRFEVPTRYRDLERPVVRYARWNLGIVHLVDETNDVLLCQLYPLDRAQNADGRRRALPEPQAPTQPAPKTGMAPLLKDLIAQYAATGLPPAYLPKDEIVVDNTEVTR